MSFSADVAAGLKVLTLTQSTAAVSIAAGSDASALALGLAQHAVSLSYGCRVIADEALALALAALPATLVVLSGDVIANISIQLIRRGMEGQLKSRGITISKI